MRLVERGLLDTAAAAFAPLAGAAGDGIVARFRRAECLSRLGRHDEAIAEAQRAHDDDPDAPATGLWLAQALAEAGRLDDAAAVRHPGRHSEFVGPVAAGYVGLAHLGSVLKLGTGLHDEPTPAPAPASPGDRTRLSDAIDAILSSRHAPLYSLALRVSERARLAREPRWPDLQSFWYRHECTLEMEEDGLTTHPAVPPISTRGGFLGAFLRRSQNSDALRWLRIHTSCGDWSALIASIRAAGADAEILDEIELEMLLALGRLDEADALVDRAAKAAGKDAAGELAIARCRLAQLHGHAARPSDFDGFDDAKRRLGDAIAWLECCAALMQDDPIAARAAADRVSDPSHGEYVEASLLRLLA